MKYKKQHPYFLLSKIFSSIKELILAFVVLIGAALSKSKNEKMVILALFLVVIIIIAITIISWKNNVYSFDENSMSIREGVIKRKSRDIPSDKIHTMDIDSKFIQRLFGIVTLRIDTASGGKEAEVCLVLSKNEAENIKKVLFNECIKENEKEEKAQIQQKCEKFLIKNNQYKATIIDLVITAMTSKYILGGIFFIFALYGKINDMLPKDVRNRVNDFEDRSAEGIIASKSIKIIIVFILAVIVITFIISVIATVIRYYDFTVTRINNKINITYGLLDKKSVIIPVHRIQSVSIVEGMLKKPFDAVTINVQSIGYGKEKGESTMLCPLLKKNKIDKFFKEVLTEITPEFEFSHSSKKSFIGYLMRNGLVPLLIGIFIAYRFKYGYLSFIVAFLFFLLGYYKYKSTGICIKENELIMQFRILAKYVVIMPKKNIQSVTKTQNVFQKRNNLVNIKAAVQGELVQEEHTIKGMNESEFEKLQKWMLDANFENI